MDDLLMNIDLNNSRIETLNDSIHYLAEKLSDATYNAEPNNEDLKKCYYDTENISFLLFDCSSIISEIVSGNEKLIHKARKKAED